MKTIKFEGQEYEVEDWVNYVARDEECLIFGYELEPIKGGRSWHPIGFEGRMTKLYLAVPWNKSLVKV